MDGVQRPAIQLPFVDRDAVPEIYFSVPTSFAVVRTDGVHAEN